MKPYRIHVEDAFLQEGFEDCTNRLHAFLSCSSWRVISDEAANGFQFSLYRKLPLAIPPFRHAPPGITFGCRVHTRVMTRLQQPGKPAWKISPVANAGNLCQIPGSPRTRPWTSPPNCNPDL
jgi:hypothetical protein